MFYKLTLLVIMKQYLEGRYIGALIKDDLAVKFLLIVWRLLLDLLTCCY